MGFLRGQPSAKRELKRHDRIEIPARIWMVEWIIVSPKADETPNKPMPTSGKAVA
jgi:hypothetical protein